MRIDTHAHIAPKELIPEMGEGYALERKADGSTLIRTPAYRVPVPEEMFSPDEQIKKMESQGMEMRAISLAPFLMANEKNGLEAAAWMRRANDFVAECQRRDPEHFIGFGYLQLANVEEAVKEIDRCAGELGLAGFELPTNFRGENLDDARFEPVFQRLNERALPIIIHPTLVRMGDYLQPYYLKNLLGNPFETAVAAARMLLSGFFTRYPSLRILFSHGGGAFPALIGRIAHRHPSLCDDEGRIVLPGNVYLDEVVFDADMLRYLNRRFDHLVFGTDAPFDMAESEPLLFAQVALGEEGLRRMEQNSMEFIFGRG